MLMQSQMGWHSRIYIAVVWFKTQKVCSHRQELVTMKNKGNNVAGPPSFDLGVCGSLHRRLCDPPYIGGRSNSEDRRDVLTTLRAHQTY